VTVLREFHSITGRPEKCSRRILVAGDETRRDELALPNHAQEITT
jgi:hypothetical protein